MTRFLDLYKERYSGQIDKEAVASKQKTFSYRPAFSNQKFVESGDAHIESPTSQESIADSIPLSLLSFYGVFPLFILILARAFSIPLQEINAEVKGTIENLQLATLSLDQPLSYIGKWPASLHYGVTEQGVLSLLAPHDQETLLMDILSTPEIAVTVDATKENLRLSIKARRWLSNWNAYMEHLKKIDFDNFAKEIEMPASLVVEISVLLKTYFANLMNYYKEDVKLDVMLNPGIQLRLHIPNYPCLSQDLEEIFNKNGFDDVGISRQEDKLELKFNLPFDRLEREETLKFKELFAKKLIKINSEVVAQIETRKANLSNSNRIVTNLKTLHVEPRNLTYRAEKNHFDWVFESNRLYQFDNEAIETEEFASILQYLLHKLYGLRPATKRKDESYIVSHPYFVGNVADKKGEADVLINDIIKTFTCLRQRYRPAVCKLLYEGEEMKVQLFLKELSTLFEGISKEQLFDFVIEELEVKGVHARRKKSRGITSAVILLSPPRSALPEFKCTFEEFCAQKIKIIRLTKETEEKEKERIDCEEKLNWIAEELNDFIADNFVQLKDLKWQTNSDEVAIELILNEASYYSKKNLDSEGAAIEISRNAFSVLILNYLQQGRGITKIDIVARQQTLQIRNPIQLLFNPRQPYVLPLERLSTLAKLYRPMRISLISDKGNLNVIFILDEERTDMPSGLGVDKFVNCVLQSLMRAEIEEKDITQRGYKFSIPLEKITSNECRLPNEAEFFTIIQAELEKEEPPIEKAVEKKETEKIVSTQIVNNTNKGKEEASAQNAVLPRSICFDKHEQSLQVIQRNQDKFDVHKKYDLGRLLGPIKVFLEALEEERAREQGVGETVYKLKLYKCLSKLMEILNECAKQFAVPYAVVPKWFKNIEDPANSSLLRIYIIKGLNISGHSEFIELAARRILEIKTSRINLLNIINEGLPASKNNDFNALEIIIDYDAIKSNVETLKNFKKVGEHTDNVDTWVRRNIDLVHAVFIQTYELFNEKNQQLPQETQQKLGWPLYKMLLNARSMRNTIVHLDPQLGTPKIMEETLFILELNKLDQKAPSPGYGANSSRIFRGGSLTPSSSGPSSSSGYVVSPQ